MSYETCTVKINQKSLLGSSYVAQYTVTGHDMSQFKKDWDECKAVREKSGDMWDDESQLVSDMEALGYEFDSNNYDVIEVDA